MYRSDQQLRSLAKLPQYDYHRYFRSTQTGPENEAQLDGTLFRYQLSIAAHSDGRMSRTRPSFFPCRVLFDTAGIHENPRKQTPPKKLWANSSEEFALNHHA